MHHPGEKEKKVDLLAFRFFNASLKLKQEFLLLFHVRKIIWVSCINRDGLSSACSLQNSWAVFPYRETKLYPISVNRQCRSMSESFYIFCLGMNITADKTHDIFGKIFESLVHVFTCGSLQCTQLDRHQTPMSCVFFPIWICDLLYTLALGTTSLLIVCKNGFHTWFSQS